MITINDAYDGNPKVKKDGVVQTWTEEEVEEYIRCSKDPVYFTKNYCKAVHPDRGMINFDPYPYQKKMFKIFSENRFSVVLACRQSGKTMGAVGYLLWYAVFHPDKTVLILANKGDTARNILSRLLLMYENLPFFLQPGCRALARSYIEMSNNSQIRGLATGSSAARSYSANLIYLDEFAFVNRADEFYTSVYPVISAGTTTQIIVTSTANGVGNRFHKIWEGAMQGTNEFVPFRVDWWDVPGRDEKWKLETIKNTSELQFAVEFGNSFLGTGDTLIDADTLMSLKAKEPLYISGNTRVYEESKKGHEYVLIADVAKGRGQDASTFNVIDITSKPFRQAAVYQNNKISPLLFPNEIYRWATAYNEAYVVVESNDQGMVVCNGLYYELEYENMHLESASKGKLGVEMTRKVKRLGCSGFKTVLEARGLEVCDAETIREISTFEARGSSFEATDGNHDDLVMNLVMFGYFVHTKFFSNMTDESLRSRLYEDRIREIEEDVLPFGFIEGDRYAPAPPREDPGRHWGIVTVDPSDYDW